MRGKGSQVRCAACSARITPAYAGKSSSAVKQKIHHKDHPRLCGEKVPAAYRCTCQRGSPPPMRGKAGTPARGLPADGITPAYAGKSIPEDDRHASHGDHPRLCGEKVPVKRVV